MTKQQKLIAGIAAAGLAMVALGYWRKASMIANHKFDNDFGVSGGW